MKLEAMLNKSRLWVHYKGRIYNIAAEQKRSSSGIVMEEEISLSAPFSCKVLKVHVTKNQEVKKGDPVLVVEAMKMEYSYASPRSGVIAEVLVQEGKIIPQGAEFVRWKDKL